MELKRNDMSATDGASMKITESWRYWTEKKQMKEKNIHEKTKVEELWNLLLHKFDFYSQEMTHS